MILRTAHFRRLGWASVLGLSVIAFLAMSFHVNAVKSDVHLKEREIVALERKKTLLETEFQTRANQQQLSNWNAIDFGYRAPVASQYLENDRQLVALGLPHRPGEPDPIRVARSEERPEAGFPAMVSPLTGKPVAASEIDGDESAPAPSLDVEPRDSRDSDSESSVPEKGTNLAGGDRAAIAKPPLGGDR